uniref:Uncharacterized protein n=1 Tax=Ciona intestinalis TaxID=7719 RepID=H2XL21_CIOIN
MNARLVYTVSNVLLRTKCGGFTAIVPAYKLQSMQILASFCCYGYQGCISDLD